jgi:hypothetical protein
LFFSFFCCWNTSGMLICSAQVPRLVAQSSELLEEQVLNWQNLLLLLLYYW